MVKVGDFTVELVRADSKEAFKEHAGPDPGNHVYAEVEPGLDYFIRAESSRGNVRVRAKVDGVDLGYRHQWKSPNHGAYLGSWQRTDGMDKVTALRFSAAPVKCEGAKPSMLTGKVEVVFHEILSRKIAKNVWIDCAPKELTGGSQMGGKKCVVSTKGTHLLEKKKKKAKRLIHKRGAHLCTITLHYCTALGLIVNKVLNSPDPANNETQSLEVKSESDEKRVKLENAEKRIKLENAEKRIKLEHDEMRIKLENDEKRSREEDDDSIEILPEDNKPRTSTEAVKIDLTGDDGE